MSRYNHYLLPPRPTKWPERVLCLDVVTREHKIVAMAGSIRPVCERWVAAALTREHAGYGVGSTWAGRRPEVFWTELERITRKDGDLWILSRDCDLDWSVLGLWEEIENGSVEVQFSQPTWEQAHEEAVRKLRETNPGASGVPTPSLVRRLQSRPQGTLLIGGPPCVARFRFRGSKSWVTWVDLRNYGVHLGSEHEHGMATCMLMKGWWNEWKEMVDRVLGVGPRWTGGDMAFCGWRRSYMEGGVYAHDCPRALALESASYFGGRCEPFFLGRVDKPVFHLDFRSLYPSVCVNRDLPVRLRYVYPPDGCVPAVAELQPSNSIACVSIAVDQPYYPCRFKGEVIYPVGRFITTLAGPELELAKRMGHIERVHQVAEYDMEPVLSEYMIDLYAERCRAESDGSELFSRSVKHLLVSLPGKFAQRSTRWVEVPGEDNDIQYGLWYGSNDAGEPCRYRCMGGEVEREEKADWSYNAVPAIGAWITSAGRVRLLEAINTAGWENVYYCDTDSVLVNKDGYDRLASSLMVDSNCLGKLTLKCGPVNAEIHGIKWYVEDGKVTCSGEPKGDKVDCGNGKHYQARLPVNSYLKKGQRPQADMHTYTYNRSLIYRHGVVHEDGTVTPHVLG